MSIFARSRSDLHSAPAAPLPGRQSSIVFDFIGRCSVYPAKEFQRLACTNRHFELRTGDGITKYSDLVFCTYSRERTLHMVSVDLSGYRLDLRAAQTSFVAQSTLADSVVSKISFSCCVSYLDGDVSKNSDKAK